MATKLPLCLSCNSNRVAFPVASVAGEVFVEHFTIAGHRDTRGERIVLALVRRDGKPVTDRDLDRERGMCLDCGGRVQD